MKKNVKTLSLKYKKWSNHLKSHWTWTTFNANYDVKKYMQQAEYLCVVYTHTIVAAFTVHLLTDIIQSNVVNILNN